MKLVAVARKRTLGRLLVALTAGLLAPCLPALAEADRAATEEVRELKETVQLLLQRIEQLEQKQSGMQQKQQEIAESQEQIAEEVERGATGKLAQWAEKTQVGGYGEMHWNNTNLTDEIDLHRVVMFLGHEFTDDIRFFSEIEIEHDIAGEDKVGEVEVEQAFMEFDLNDRLRAKAGVFLVPVGILNETHEPDTFYGVERNNVEKDIIPATWWEGGVGLSGDFGAGWNFDLAAHSGLDAKKDAAYTFKPRDGRQKVGEAPAEDPAYTARLAYRGIAGLELAAAVQYQADLTQSNSLALGGIDQAEALLWETHLLYNRGPFGLRGLYAEWDVDGTQAKALGRDRQYGWYLEPSYRFLENWGVFARYSEWDNEAGGSGDSAREQRDFGFNYWPTDNVVLKVDYMNQEKPGTDERGFNMGVGWSFN